MTLFSLRDLNHEIESLIDRAQYDEAIFHCVNILRSYPKCVDTYRNLGKALLESKRYADSAEVFAKVLAVYPDDLVSHVGLSVIQEENRDLDSSIWHMEQAYDTQPSNIALQEELRRLLGRRDGISPTKVRLSRGALIRMYARGELYQQAISEIQSSLQEDENRLDFQVLLAKMYFLSGVNVDAAETASKILTHYPFCYEANKILFDLLPETENDTSSIYKQNLTAVDPYFEFVSNKVSLVEEVPSDNIKLEKSLFTPTSYRDGTVPEWAKIIGIDWKNGDITSSIPGSEIDPLKDLFSKDEELSSKTPPVNPFIDSQIHDSENFKDEITPEPVEELLPDWIANAGWTRAEDVENQEKDNSNSSDAEEGKDDASLAEEVPNWVKSMQLDSTGETPLSTESPASMIESPQSENQNESSTLEHIPSSQDLKDSLSKWSILSEEIKAPIDQEPDENVDWANQVMNGLPDDIEGAPDELPEWLRNFEQENIPSESNNEDDTEWLKQLNQVADENTSIDMPAAETVNDRSAEMISSDQDLIDSELPTPTAETVIQNEIDDQFSTPLPVPTETSEPPIENIVDLPEQVSENQPDQLPSWIKNILSSTPPTIPLEEKLEPDEIDSNSTEPVESLVTELPDNLNHKGAISSETHEELLSWLREINPDNEEANSDGEKSNIDGEVLAEQEEAPEISLSNLVNQSIEPGVESEIPLESLAAPEEELDGTDYNDRLSDLLEEPATDTISPSEIPESIIEQPDENPSEQPDQVTEIDLSAFSVNNIPPDNVSDIPDSTLLIEEESIFDSIIGSELTPVTTLENGSQDIDNPLPESEKITPDTQMEEIEEFSVTDDSSGQSIIPEPSTELDSEIESKENDKLENLLQKNDFSNLNQAIDESISSGIPIDTLLESLQKVEDEKHDNYEYWQVVGDLYSKTANLDEAINAYSKAEKILLK